MSVSKPIVAPAITPLVTPAPRPTAAKSPFMLFSEACEVTTFTRQFLYGMIERGEFCSPVKLGIRRKAFVRTEVEAWVADRIAASRPLGKVAKVGK